jgi:hypothetical protein
LRPTKVKLLFATVKIAVTPNDDRRPYEAIKFYCYSPVTQIRRPSKQVCEVKERDTFTMKDEEKRS